MEILGSKVGRELWKRWDNFKHRYKVKVAGFGEDVVYGQPLPSRMFSKPSKGWRNRPMISNPYCSCRGLGSVSITNTVAFNHVPEDPMLSGLLRHCVHIVHTQAQRQTIHRQKTLKLISCWCGGAHL